MLDAFLWQFFFYNIKFIKKQPKEIATVKSSTINDNPPVFVNGLGLLDNIELDGNEEVSNVRPSVYKSSEVAMDSMINWKLNNIATVTTKNGDVITIEFSDKTLTDLIRNTLS